MNHRILRVFPLLALCFLSGCLISHTSDQSVSGNYVPPSTFDQIERGKTTAGWVKATLGEPSTREKVENGTEVWKYSYTERTNSSGAIFLIFGGSDRKEKQRVAYVEMKDGIVTNKWRG
jgi:outer membrane protein assembly factor BamE (lipoprotein component of BamABCDE complex)